MTSTNASARVGSTLAGKYHVDRLLGEGGMAAVYQATHSNGNRVAVKVLDPGLARSADCRQRFLREGYVANKVDHPGAICVLDDAVAADGSPFLVMELLEGETIHDLLERSQRPLDPRVVADLACSVLDVLVAAHAAGVVHRDIKPANIFLRRDGSVKLLDFGVARLRDPRSPIPCTKAGQLLGTPAFMAPEQLGGRVDEIDGRTDLWAVGATMFMLMTGECVHPATGLADLLVAGTTQPARSLRLMAPTIPDGIARVVDCALAFDKRDRWKTARQMRAALDAAITAAYRLPRAAPSFTPSAKPRPPRSTDAAATVLGPISPPITPRRAMSWVQIAAIGLATAALVGSGVTAALLTLRSLHARDVAAVAPQPPGAASSARDGAVAPPPVLTSTSSLPPSVPRPPPTTTAKSGAPRS